MNHKDHFSVKKALVSGGKEYVYYSLPELENKGFGEISKLPYSIRVLLEAAVRQFDGHAITLDHVKLITDWAKGIDPNKEIPFIPARIVLQDFTGVPVVVDLAAMRDTVSRNGGDPRRINPLVPVDLVIDHSMMVDQYGTKEALAFNNNKEFERNDERYRFLRWAQTAFDNFRAVPPATGIIHQVNLEYLASVAATKVVGDDVEVFPDSLVGTDSHTTMINGLGVLGWGVGGIEAEACMLGQPLYFVTPEVIGFRFVGALREGSTATDLALTVTEMLRKNGVVGKFVEYFGPGVDNMSLADRATVANMAPEYGATMGFFPVDAETIQFLHATGRDEAAIQLVEDYYKAQGLFRTVDSVEPTYNKVLELDLSTVVPCLAGPKRPQDRIPLDQMKAKYNEVIRKTVANGGYELSETKIEESFPVQVANKTEQLKNGAVVLAAITSCTNTSNPSVMLGAGLVAKKAVALGLVKPDYVKSSLTPGSLVVTEYLTRAGLIEPLEALGFHVVGYGCATCIGNSGPLPDAIEDAIANNDMTVASVLSGNRNFEGRVHPRIKANYLASPMLVVAYALAGTVDIDLYNDVIGVSPDGTPVYLKDIWPTNQEISDAVAQAVTREMFIEKYADVFKANKVWNEIPVPTGDLYEWDKKSTYIAEPPFFENLTVEVPDIDAILDASVFAILGDSVTTDHISPAGNINAKSPAGVYLQAHGVPKEDFNSYGSRRGHHEVMMRGTFANIRIRNAVAKGIEGGYSCYQPTGEVLPMYDVAMRYVQDEQPLVIFAGKEYGTGSSRDWAAKGTFLLGVKAVIAESYERIHRSNLVGMGVLPLQFQEGQTLKSFELDGTESISIPELKNVMKPGQLVNVVVIRKNGKSFNIQAHIRLDSLVDLDYYRNGGILQTVLRQIIQ